MALNLDEFLERRPYIYHLTSKSNLHLIISSKELYSATELLESAGKESLIRKKRPSSLRLVLNGHPVTLRDQEPLHSGNMELQRGWTLDAVVKMLNNHVYFWPGDAKVPIKYGIRHYERYAKLGEDLVMLQIKLADLLAANPGSQPKFSRYNSGSPRCSGGKRSPRGDDTFLDAFMFEGTPSDVVEIVFERQVQLPDSIGYGILSGNRWETIE